MGLPALIIGGVLGGLFTPTEAAAAASVYAFIPGCFAYREIRWADLPDILWNTVQQSVKVLFIIAAAGFFGWLLIHRRIPEQVITGITSITESRWVFLPIINGVLLILVTYIPELSRWAPGLVMPN